MFGLMRLEQSCSNKVNGDYRYHRMHYCGTCKTLGQQYGQQTRVLLNFDTVFFAEILSQLSNENLSEWQKGYQAINECLKMPDQKKTIPLSLRYAATTNVLWGEIKSDDNIKDLSAIKWKLIRQFFSKSFQKANQQFEAWGIDTTTFWNWVEKQDELEKTKKAGFKTLEALFGYYAEPTAQITALIFKHGAIIIGQAEQSLMMYQLGYQFGRLIYSLDAFEDVEKDLFRKHFNPLLYFFKIHRTLHDHQLEKVRKLILEYQEEVVQHIKMLPFPQEVIDHYIRRLRSNIALRLYKEREVPKGLREEFQIFWNTIFAKTGQLIFTAIQGMRNANYYLISLVIFVFPIAANYLSDNNKEEIYKWVGIFTAVLATIGLGQFIRTQHKKQEFKPIVLSFNRRIKKIYSHKQRRNESCGTECINACCPTCCEALCESCCGEVGRKKWFKIVIFIFAGILLTAMIIQGVRGCN